MGFWCDSDSWLWSDFKTFFTFTSFIFSNFFFFIIRKNKRICYCGVYKLTFVKILDWGNLKSRASRWTYFTCEKILVGVIFGNDINHFETIFFSPIHGLSYHMIASISDFYPKNGSFLQQKSKMGPRFYIIFLTWNRPLQSSHRFHQ